MAGRETLCWLLKVQCSVKEWALLSRIGVVMILDVLPLAGGTARLVRVYGGEPCVKLPGAVPAPEGEGQWPITELGDYCFSEKPRGLPGPEKICRYERAEDGKLSPASAQRSTTLPCSTMRAHWPSATATMEPSVMTFSVP